MIENNVFSNFNVGTAIFSGLSNAAFTLLTMGSMNLWMANSYRPALLGKTFASRFVEFMSFDFGITVGSTYFGMIWGIANSARLLIQGAIDKEINEKRIIPMLR